MPEVIAALVTFARALREAGVETSAERVQAMLSGAAALGVTTPGGAYWAGRLALCGEPDDLPIYDATFAEFFGAPAPKGNRPPQMIQSTAPRLVATLVPEGAPEGADSPERAAPLASSPAEILRQRDLAALSPAERDEVRRLLALLAPRTAPRVSRRYRPGRGEVDRARTVRRMLRQGGEATRLAERERRHKPRRLVLLLDVSGSMAPYADGLLRFAHAAVRRRPTLTEVFTIGTRLTRVTRALRHRDPDAALKAAGAAIPDWHGGTRLAQSLQAFLDRWGQRGTARGAVVVLCSDGWERGDPGPLAAQMARLSRLAYRLVWVNPHRGKAGFEPLAAGMAAALPFLDDFVAGHNLDALTELARVIARS